jgi:thiamine biosynthesis lipoprotein
MAAVRAAFQAIGTHWEIRVDQPMAAEQWTQLQKRLHERIDAFDTHYSRFRADSLITRMSQRAGTYDLPADGYTLLQFYEQLYAATNGAVTPLIGQALADAGYDAAYSFQPKTLATPPRWEDVLSYNRHAITLQQPALLDFGAAGKGY